MKKEKTLRNRLKEDSKNPEFHKAFDEEEVYASLAIQVVKIRQKNKLTQIDPDD